jgi:hypothetical protein
LSGNLLEKAHFNDKKRDGRITLNCISEKWNTRVREEWKMFRMFPVEVIGGKDVEPSGSAVID